VTSLWYVVQIQSGSEKKVAQAIMEKAVKLACQDLFEQVIVPTENVVEVKKGKKVNAEKRIYPGYVLAKMVMNDDTWHLVKNISKVNGFLGSGGKPKPISESEIKEIFSNIEERVNSPKSTLSYEVGESIKIIDGPFDSFIGVVEEVDNEKSRLKVSVSIFGRATPVDLEFTQVAKVN
jgi:transcription termination/antitermination protein NusG